MTYANSIGVNNWYKNIDFFPIGFFQNVIGQVSI